MRIVYSFAAAVIVGAFQLILIKRIDRDYDINLRKRWDVTVDALSLTIVICGMIVTFWHVFVDYKTLAVPELFVDMTIIIGTGVLAITDFYKKIVPNRIILILLGVWLLLVGIWTAVILLPLDSIKTVLVPEGGRYLGIMTFLFDAVLGSVIAGGIFLLCYIISRGKLGAGDVKLVFVMGMYITSERILGAVLYGCVFCLIVSMILVLKKKLTMKDGVPMVPFLYAGMMAAYLIL